MADLPGFVMKLDVHSSIIPEEEIIPTVPPKYRRGDNLELFLKVYKSSAKANGRLDDAMKLEKIHVYFKSH